MSRFASISPIAAAFGPTTLTYYLTGTNSSIAGYESLKSLAQFVPTAEQSVGVVATTSPTLIEEFATDVGYPNITKLVAGSYGFHYETQKAAGSNNYYTYAELYKRNLAGTETLLLTSDNSAQSAVNTRIQTTITGTLLSDTTLLTTDRLIIKIYAVMLSSTATITLYWDNNTAARITLPYLPADATNFVPYVGSTANLNLGSTYKVINMIDPSSAQDAATKNYVDALVLPTTSVISASDIDWSTLLRKGGLYTKTLSANTTFTFSNRTAGQTIVVRLTNTASNYTVTWPTVKWHGGAAPTMTIGAKSDIYTFIYDGTDIFGSAVQDLS